MSIKYSLFNVSNDSILSRVLIELHAAEHYDATSLFASYIFIYL